MTESLEITNNYSQLVSDLKSLIEKGQTSALNSVNQIRLTTYWEMGKRLAAAKELSEGSTSSTEPALSEVEGSTESTKSSLVAKLSEDLGLDSSLIYRITMFYRAWPDGVPSVQDAPTLSWSHYVELLNLSNPDERSYYLVEASKQDWSRAQLRKAVKKDLFHSRQTNDGTATLKRDTRPMYVYKAIVQSVVDGDTLLVRIDLGFNVWVDQRIRFRGINTAELSSNDVESKALAEKAKGFVEEKLKDIPFIVIKTYKTDIYGRYVADVFYHPTISKKEDVAVEGFFLNEELLKAGLAAVML